MRIDSASADHVTARRRKDQTAAAGTHRPCQQDGSTDSAAHIRIQIGRFHVFCLDLPSMGIDFFEGDPEAFDQFAHCRIPLKSEFAFHGTGHYVKDSEFYFIRKYGNLQ